MLHVSLCGADYKDGTRFRLSEFPKCTPRLQVRDPKGTVRDVENWIMFDLDAGASDFVHYVVNMKRSLIEYMPPKPPPGSGEHRYVFEAFDKPVLPDAQRRTQSGGPGDVLGAQRSAGAHSLGAITLRVSNDAG